MDFEEFKTAYEDCKKQGMTLEQIKAFAQEGGLTGKEIDLYIETIKKRQGIWYQMISSSAIFTFFTCLLILPLLGEERPSFLTYSLIWGVFLFPLIVSIIIKNYRKFQGWQKILTWILLSFCILGVVGFILLAMRWVGFGGALQIGLSRAPYLLGLFFIIYIFILSFKERLKITFLQKKRVSYILILMSFIIWGGILQEFIRYDNYIKVGNQKMDPFRDIYLEDADSEALYNLRDHSEKSCNKLFIKNIREGCLVFTNHGSILRAIRKKEKGE